MSTSDRPNILWISVEDTTPRFGCYGDTVARTPNIDRLAAGGCRFPNAFSTAGVCAPSRSAIITGMYQTSIGTHHMRTTHTNENTPNMPTPYSAVPPPYVKTFTEYLRGAGYYCTNISKTDYQFTPAPSRRGMHVITPRIGAIAKQVNRSFQFLTQLLRMKAACGNGRIVR